jgi:hypothetical protein
LVCGRLAEFVLVQLSGDHLEIYSRTNPGHFPQGHARDASTPSFRSRFGYPQAHEDDAETDPHRDWHLWRQPQGRTGSQSRRDGDRRRRRARKASPRPKYRLSPTFAGRVLGEHNHLCTYRNAVVKVGDIFIGHPNAAGRHAMADGPRLVGAVNPVQRVLVALP